MRRNIKRNLAGLDLISFNSGSNAPVRAVRRKVELEVINPVNPPNVQAELESEPSCEESNCFDEGGSSELFEFREQDCLFDGDSSSDSDEEQESQEQTITNYARREENSAKNWAEIRSKLRDAVTESECIPAGQPCCKCNSKNADFRCVKCGMGNFFREDCIVAIHQDMCVFHVIEQWKVSASF